MAPMPSLLFRCFSLFLPHLRTLAQEKRSHSEANRDGSDAESRFPLFFSLLRTLAREKRLENCLPTGTGGPSLCLYLLLSRNTIFCPALTMAARAKKKFWLSDLLTPSA